MYKSWKDIIYPVWPWTGRTNVSFPVVPTLPVDELWRGFPPTPLGVTPLPPSASISSASPRGGLFSSLDGGRGGGILGNLGPPLQQLGSGEQGVAARAPPHTSMSRNFGSDTTADMLSEPRDEQSWNVLAGNSNVPPWLNGGGLQTSRNVISDVTPDNDWIPNAQYAGDGHHHVPRPVYEKLPLQDETRSVFNKGTTGPLPWYRWHQNDALHRAYSEAVAELVDRFMREIVSNPKR